MTTPRALTSPGATVHDLDNEAAIQAFLAWLVAAGAAPGSLKVRRSHLEALAHRGPLNQVTEADCVALLAARKHLAPESRRGMVSSWRTFFRFAVIRGFIDHDPTEHLATIRVPAGLPRPITEKALEHAFTLADNETRLMLLLGAYAGLRRAEIAKVHSHDVEFPWLRVKGKGGKTRRVPIHSRLAPELHKLDGWAFPSIVRIGQPVTADYVSDRLSKVLPTPFTPHSLRHRFATMAYRGTHDLRAVGEMLGHAKAETTMRYTLIDDESMMAAVASIAA